MYKIFAFFAILVFSQIYSQKKFPEVLLKDINGNSFSTFKNFSEKDKIYIFPLWATWCVPCIEELEAFEELYADYKSNSNIEIIAVSIDDSRTTRRVKPLINGKGWDFTILLDTNQELKRKLGVSAVPYLVVVKNGEIILTKSGHNPGGEKELLEQLKNR